WPIRRYGSSSLKMRSPISAISAGIASRQHSACSDILPSAPISVILFLLPPLSFYHPLLFQQTHRNLVYKPTNHLRSSAPTRAGASAAKPAGCRRSNLQSPISNLQSPISNLQSPISNLQSPISNLQSPI